MMVAALKLPEQQPFLFIIEAPTYTDFDVTKLRRIIRHMKYGDCIRWGSEQLIHDIPARGKAYFLLRTFRGSGRGNGWKQAWKETIAPPKEAQILATDEPKNIEKSRAHFRETLDELQCDLAERLAERGWRAECVQWVTGRMT